MTTAARCGAVLLAALGTLAPARAWARSVVVVPLAAGDGITADEAQAVGDEVAAAIRERGHEVLGPADTIRALDRHEPGCVASRRPSCWATGARANGSDLVVSGRIAREASTEDVAITLEAIDVQSVQVVSEASHHAVATPGSALGEIVRAVAARLLDRLPEPRRHARLSVTSEPRGAAVTVNSRVMGQTPWTGEVPEGPTILLVELEGHVPQSRSFALQADEVQEVHVELAAEDDATPPASRGRGPHRLDTLDGVLIAVAAAGVVVGTIGTVASLAPGDDCRGGPDCPVVESSGTWWPFAAIAGVGVAAAAVVVVRLLLGDPAPRDVVAGPMGLGARF